MKKRTIAEELRHWLDWTAESANERFPNPDDYNLRNAYQVGALREAIETTVDGIESGYLK